MTIAAWAARPDLIPLLERAGIEPAEDPSQAGILVLAAGAEAEVAGVVRFVVDGGGLLVCGGHGPLLAALHLTPPGRTAAGPVEAVREGLDPVADEGAPEEVGGAGYALYRAGGRCVALGGFRDRGVLAYVGGDHPALAAACLRWISRQLEPEAR